jgi:hypothetical protein
MNCGGDSSYTLNIIKNNTINKTFTIDTTANQTTNEIDTNEIDTTCRDLGMPTWGNVLTEPENKNFINKQINKIDSCFINENENEKNYKEISPGSGQYNCYISKECTLKGKVVNYMCINTDKSIDRDTDLSTSSSTTQPITCPSHINPTNIWEPRKIDTTKNPHGYIRCKQGYVTKQLAPDNNGKKYVGGYYNCNKGEIWWTNEKTTNSYKHDWTGECVPDTCDDMTIHDSNKEWDPLHSSHGEPKIKVRCNEGYIFNHDLLHQGGFVKCDYDLIQDKTEFNKNNMNWYIHDDRLEDKCNAYKTKDTCMGENGNDPPTYEPFEYLNTVNIERKLGLYSIEKHSLHGIEGTTIGCQWAPDLTDSMYNSNITQKGRCHFRKPVNNETAPVCKPVHCPSKHVANSNYSIDNNALPGPIDVTPNTKGNCIDKSGEVISDILNSEDCLCYKHKSCNTCTHNIDCQWCSEEGKSGCYDTKSNNSICDNKPIRQKTGGSCINTFGNMKPGWKKLGDINASYQNINNCEDTFQCINSKTQEPIPKTAPPDVELSIENLQQNYIRNKNTDPPEGRDLCMSYNNNFIQTSSTPHTSNDNFCYFSKDIINNNNIYTDIRNTVEIGLWVDEVDEDGEGEGDNHISTAPYYCLSKTQENIKECASNKEIHECGQDCVWRKNALSDDLLHWSKKGSYKDIIKITNSKGKTCVLCKNTTSAILGKDTCDEGEEEIPMPSKFKVSGGDDSNYITLQHDDMDVTIDTAIQNNCSLLYVDKNTNSKNNQYNIDPQTLRILNNTSELDADRPISCIDGYTWCEADDDNMCNYIDGSKEAGLYNPTLGNVCNKPSKCKPSNMKCSTQGIKTDIPSMQPIDGDEDVFYSLSSKEMFNIPDTIEESCNSTNYTYEDITHSNTGYKYGTCTFNNFDDNDKRRCDLINKKAGLDDTAYWGKYCSKDNNNTKVPTKVVCEKLRDTKGNYEWVMDYDKLKSTWRGVCINKDKDKDGLITVMNDEDLCGTEVQGITDGDLKPDEYDKCIIMVKDDVSTGVKVEHLCEQWEIDNNDFRSNNKFVYKMKPDSLLDSNDTRDNRHGTCIIGDGRNKNAVGLRNVNNCEKDNNVYTKEYTYNNDSYCKEGQRNNTPDEYVNWTGGEYKSDKHNNAISDCSSSLFSSCLVKCDDGYGGGGHYTCNYNNHSNEVCEHVQDEMHNVSIPADQRDICESYANCKYTEGPSNNTSTCTVIENDDNDDNDDNDEDDTIKGQAEWLGHRCYKLNNDAFSHGIYNLPTLNEAFPPLLRLIAFFMILIVLLLIFKWIGAFKHVANLIQYIIKGGSSSFLKGLLELLKSVGKSIMDVIKSFINTFNQGKLPLADSIVYFKTNAFTIITTAIAIYIGINGLLMYKMNQIDPIYIIKALPSIIIYGYEADIAREYLIETRQEVTNMDSSLLST